MNYFLVIDKREGQKHVMCRVPRDKRCSRRLQVVGPFKTREEALKEEVKR